MTESEQSRFQFVRQLGGGVLGEVHEVVDEITGESVRLKIFLRCRPQNLENFRMEFEALSRLSQPNLAKMLRLIDPASDTNIVLEEKVGTPNLAFTQELVIGCSFLEYLSKPENEDERAIVSAANTDTLTPRTFELETLPPVDDSAELEPRTGETGEIFQKDDDGLHEVFRKESSELVDASSIIVELAQEKESASLDVVLLRLKKTIPGIVSGLEYLHRFQKPHGNLRPSNIIVSDSGQVKLTDYGIVASLVVNHENENQTPLLQAPEYLPFTAPEITGNEVSPESDLYALGCILFEAISGVSPFDALEFDLVDGQRRLQPPPLSDYVPACPSSWGELVDGLLRPNPAERLKLGDIVPFISGTDTYSVHIQTDRIGKVVGFRGRKSELSSIIQDAKSATENNQQRLTLVRGETGTGKSALLQQSAHYLSRRGWLVLKSSCFHWENEVHQSWSEIAKTLAKVLDSYPVEMREQLFAARSKATRVLKDLGGSLDSSLDGIGRNACVLALHELLKSVSREKPILLIFDDIENASWDTSSLLVDLLCIPDSFRALVLLSFTSDAHEEQPRLLEDLERTLIDYRTLNLEAMEQESPAAYFSGLPTEIKRSDYPLVSKWWTSFPQALEDALKHRDIVNSRTLALHSAAAVYQELRSVEKIVTCLICISSNLLPRDIIAKIATRHSKKYQPHQVSEAIDALLDLEFIREHGDEIELAHDTIRVVMLENTDASLVSSLYKKLSKASRNNRDLSIEYAHRAGDNRNSISESIAAAENAARSFAFHRCSAIWKWIDLHKETMPGKQKKDYIEEWANAEYMAQAYTGAAALFHQVLEENPANPSVSMKICESHLWSNNLIDASRILETSIEQQGGKLQKRNPLSAFSRDISFDEIDSKKPTSELSIAYHFAGKYAVFLAGTFADGAAHRLVNLAKTEGPQTWRFAQSAKVRVNYNAKLSTPAEIFSTWARSYRKHTDTEDENLFFLQKIRLRFGKRTASFSHEIFEEMDPRASINVLVDALDFCREVLLFGGREKATKFALDVIRANHRNRFLSSVAYQILIQDAIYRNDLEGALLYFELAGFVADFDDMSDFDALNFICEADVSILQGECEVALARYQLLSKSRAFSRLSPRSKANLSLGTFRALAAQYRRDVLLGSKRINETLKAIGDVSAKLKKLVGCGDPYLAAAGLRALALGAYLNGKNRKSERYIRNSIERLDGRFCPLVNAISLEALAVTETEEKDTQGMFDSSVLLQTNFGYSQLLQQEGWPAFEDIAKK